MHVSYWGISALLVTVVLLYLLHPLSFRFGLLDCPGKRKRHDADTPLSGGPAVFGGPWVAGLAALAFARSSPDFRTFSAHPPTRGLRRDGRGPEARPPPSTHT